MTTTEERPSTVVPPGRRGFRPSSHVWVWVGVVFVYLVTLATTPSAVSPSSLLNMLPFAGMLAIAAVGQTLVVMQRGIDFSVPGTIVMTGIIVAALTDRGWAPPVAIAVSLLAGLGSGVVSGLIVVRLGLPPLVATLAANGIFLGVALLICGGFPINAAQSLSNFSRGQVLGVSSSTWIAVIAVALLVLLINKMTAGRRFIATGSNPATSRVFGVRVTGYILGAYGVAGACYAVAGILISGYIGSARMDMGNDYLLASIAAVVIGGTPLTGGRGSLVASVGGALFMTLLTQLVLALGAPTSFQLLVQAVVLVAAVALPNIVGILRSRRAVRRSAT